jgi:hypothetical protein
MQPIFGAIDSMAAQSMGIHHDAPCALRIHGLPGKLVRFLHGSIFSRAIQPIRRGVGVHLKKTESCDFFS